MCSHGVRRSYLGNGNYLRKCQHRTRTRAIWDLRSKAHESNATMEKGEKIRRGWVAPKKRRKNARGESRHTPEFSRGCVGGAIRGVIFFLSHEDRLTRKNPFLLGWKEGTGGRRREGKKPEGIGEEEKRGKNQMRI